MEQICNSVLLWFKSLFVLVPPHPKYLFNMKLLKTYFFGQASSSCPPTFLCVPISNLAWSSYKQYWTFHFLIGTNRWNFDLFQSASRHIASKSLNINLACWTIQAGTSLLNPNLLEKMKLCSEIIYGCTVQAGENIFLMFIPLLRSLPDYNLRNSDFEKIVFYFFFKKLRGNQTGNKTELACCTHCTRFLLACCIEFCPTRYLPWIAFLENWMSAFRSFYFRWIANLLCVFTWFLWKQK